MAKKLMNSANECVLDGLEGLALIAPNIRLVEGHTIAVRADIADVKRSGKTALLCGGGAGHEPAHAGFVGKGMLTGAVSGSVFTSPPVSAIQEALLQVGKDSKGGVLAIVKNYTGDRINFGIAAERARMVGIDVETLVVNEDCALESVNKMAGRRGLAGVILVEKILGAMAEEGHTLQELAATGKRLVASMGTIGIALTPCVLPGSAGPAFTIPEDNFELGLGIHGEAGARREELGSARQVARIMLNHLTASDTGCGLPVRSDDCIVLLINNLGSTTHMEMMTMVQELTTELQERFGVSLMRVLVGAVVTSLDMKGLSVTLMRVEDKAWLKWIDRPTEAVAWQQMMQVNQPQQAARLPCLLEKFQRVETSDQHRLRPIDRDILKSCASSICQSLIASKDRFDQLDKQTGDADCGTTHARAAEAIHCKLDSMLDGSLTDFFSRLSSLVEKEMGGTSGGLYCLFFSAMAASLGSCSGVLNAEDLVTAFSCGVLAIQKAGGAAAGDKTLLDPMTAFQEFLRDRIQSGSELDLVSLAAHVQKASEATAKMTARAGRASYVGGNISESEDPGAAAFAVMVSSAVGVLTSRR